MTVDRRKALAGLASSGVFASLIPQDAFAVTYEYDALGRLRKVTYDDGRVVQYTYDAADNRTQVVSVTGAPVGTLSAGPAQIQLGGSSLLSWTTTNAATASINNGVGSVSPIAAGSISVSPAVNTTYVLTVSGIAGQTTAQTTVTIAPPTALMSANPTTVSLGSPSTLTWSTTGATSVSISNGVGSVAASGSVQVSPTATTAYVLTATGPGGQTTAQATVTISPPTASMSASPTTVGLGSPTTLTWSTTSAASVSINNGVGIVAASGSMQVTPTTNTTYVLTATGPSGQATAQAGVAIAAPTASLSASPTSILAGNLAYLTWGATNGTSASISNGVGAVSPVSGGSVGVQPATTTTYTLTVTGPGGQITAQATVTVTPQPLSATATPTLWEVPGPGQEPPPAQALASGGTPPYSYQWQRVSGSTATTASTPNSFDTSFVTTGTVGPPRVSTWRCQITDAASTVVFTNNITVRVYVN